MSKFSLAIILLLFLPMIQLQPYYGNDYECHINCGGAYSGQCIYKYSKGYECVCLHGFDGRNCTICAPGYYGVNCTFQCPLGLWGENCTNECNCSKPGSIIENACHPANGNCICKPGFLRQKLNENGTALPIWQGEARDCIFPCEPGYWGFDCQNHCDCQNDINCHHENGKCLCPPDEWTGAKCEKRCDRGIAKPGCKFTCNCSEGGLCDELTGLCYCNAGFMGPHCEWPCPNGFWGPGCQQRCKNCHWCNPINGTCEIIPPEIADRFTSKLDNKENAVNESGITPNEFAGDDDMKAK